MSGKTKKTTGDQKRVALTDIYSGANVTVTPKSLERIQRQQTDMDSITARAVGINRMRQEIESGDTTHKSRDIKDITFQAIRDVVSFITLHPRNNEKADRGRDAHYMLMHTTYSLANTAYHQNFIEIEDMQGLADIGFQAVQKLLKEEKLSSDQDQFYEKALAFKRGVKGKIQWPKRPAADAADLQSHLSPEPESLQPPAHQ